MNTGSFYDEGSCPIPVVYETVKSCIVIYDSEGNALTEKKVSLGFDLTSDRRNKVIGIEQKIKDFMTMIKEGYINQSAYADTRKGEPDYNIMKGVAYGYEEVLESEEYQALKAAVDKPISKMEVTDWMVEKFCREYHDHDGAVDSNAVRLALEAVFYHIGEVTEKVEEKQGEWMEWKGGECPVGKNVLVQIRLRLDNNQSNHTPREPQYWNWEHKWGDSDIIAYRIIPEPTEKRLFDTSTCPDCNNRLHDCICLEGKPYCVEREDKFTKFLQELIKLVESYER